MKISEYAVKNYQFTLIMFLMVIVVGVSTLVNMPRSEDPEVKFPGFPVVIVFPGTSPQDMEELIVNPIEKKIAELENIKNIKSTIKDGLAIISAEFKYNSNVDDNYQELVREINAIKGTLPPEIHSIEVKKMRPSSVNIIQVGLVSENSPIDLLKKHADRLQTELEKLPMLKSVEISGLPEQIIRIDLSLNKIVQMHIPLNVILGNLKSEMATIPGGSIEAGAKTFNIITTGNFNTVEKIKNSAVYSANGNLVLLKDVANVQADHEDQKYITRLNGHRCIFVTAAQKPGFNISNTQKKYKPVLEKFAKTLPKNIQMVQNFDQADNVNRRLTGLGGDFIIAIALVALTLLPLGFRAASVVMISIPLSLAIGVTILNLMGYNLNQLSIVGLVVALGLLVDDSIVVVENIERWLRLGHTRYEATIMATKQIGLAIIGCTATLVIAFLPIVFMPEASGDFIRSLPMAVITTVLASMIVSLTIIPFLCSHILEKNQHRDGNMIMKILKEGISRSYGQILEKSLKKPVITIIIAVILFAGSIMMMRLIGFSLFPPSEKPQFLVNIVTPFQSNLKYTDKIAKDVEKVLDNFPEIKYYATNVGKGNPMIYYNLAQENERTDYAQILIQLDESIEPKHKLDLIERLRTKFNHYSGAKIEVKNFQQGPPVIAPVEIKLFGDNLDTLSMLAGKMEDLLKNTEGTMYIDNPISNKISDMRMKINKPKAQMYGVMSSDIYRNTRMVVAGLNLGSVRADNGQDYDIIITSPNSGQVNMDVFDNLFINNNLGNAIPIHQIADLELETAPIAIRHLNKIRMTSVTAFVKKGYLNDDENKAVVEKLKHFKFPEGYSYSMGGEQESREESFNGFGTIIIATIFLFLAVLVLEFKTFKGTLIVLSVIPLGIIGAVLALALTGNSLSFVAIIGLIALAGIEVKNSILLVDFTNQLREEGKSLDLAIREAGEVRFLPILLTTLTAIFGLLPIAISTNPLISPLAIVIIGGLISSTLLSRIVTPVLYKLLPPSIAMKEMNTKNDPCKKNKNSFYNFFL